ESRDSAPRTCGQRRTLRCAQRALWPAHDSRVDRLLDLPSLIQQMNDSSFNAAAARRRCWRSISEAENGSAGVERPPDHGLTVDRRRFMKAMGASLALAGAAGCAR